jgi:hypothetical protein
MSFMAPVMSFMTGARPSMTEALHFTAGGAALDEYNQRHPLHSLRCQAALEQSTRVPERRPPHSSPLEHPPDPRPVRRGAAAHAAPRMNPLSSSPLQRATPWCSNRPRQTPTRCPSLLLSGEASHPARVSKHPIPAAQGRGVGARPRLECGPLAPERVAVEGHARHASRRRSRTKPRSKTLS